MQDYKLGDLFQLTNVTYFKVHFPAKSLHLKNYFTFSSMEDTSPSSPLLLLDELYMVGYPAKGLELRTFDDIVLIYRRKNVVLKSFGKSYIMKTMEKINFGFLQHPGHRGQGLGVSKIAANKSPILRTITPLRS